MEKKLIVDNLNLDEALAKQNCVTYGKLNLMKKVDGSDVFIPIIVICGAKEGPTFLVEACMHGEEYEGCEAILSAVKKMDPADIRGKVIAIPALNLEAFMAGNRGALHDYYGLNDMNRIYPGRNDAFFTQYLAHYHLHEIIDKADFIVDFHGGGNYLYLQPEALWLAGDDPSAKQREAMAKAFGAKAIWYDVPGNFNGAAGCMDDYCVGLGKPAMIAEVGGQASRFGFRAESVGVLERGLFNIMKLYDMIDGEPEVEPDCVIADVEYLHCHNGGIHYPQKKPLVPIKEGETLSIITDIFGNVVEEIKAPYDGIIIGYWAYSVINPRNHAYLYGKVLDK